MVYGAEKFRPKASSDWSPLPEAKEYKKGDKIEYNIPTPMPQCKPSKVERDTHYKIICGHAKECESTLNYYHDKKLLVNIEHMSATDNITTIIVKVYEDH